MCLHLTVAISLVKKQCLGKKGSIRVNSNQGPDLVETAVVSIHCKNCVVNFTTSFGEDHYLNLSLPCGDACSW